MTASFQEIFRAFPLFLFSSNARLVSQRCHLIFDFFFSISEIFRPPFSIPSSRGS